MIVSKSHGVQFLNTFLLGPLVFPGSIPVARSALPPAADMVGVLLAVFVPLWAVGAILVGVALVLGFDTGTALPVTSRRDDVSVFRRVLVTPRTLGDVRFPVASIAHRLFGIFGGGSPVQILQGVVHCIVVAVTGQRPFWPGPDKRFQHQGVDGDLPRLSIAVQRDYKVSALLRSTGEDLSQHSTLDSARGTATTANHFVQRSNPTPVGYFIVWIVPDRQPDFITGHIGNYTFSRSGVLSCR